MEISPRTIFQLLIILAIGFLQISLFVQSLSLISIVFALVLMLTIDLIQSFVIPRILLLIPFLAMLTFVTHNLILSFTLASTPILISSYFLKVSWNQTLTRQYFALVSPTIVFLFFALRRGVSGLSIFMNGDNRNHAIYLRNVILNQFVTNEQQAAYPSHSYLLPATIAKTQDSSFAIVTNVFALGIGYLVGIFLMVNLIFKFSQFVSLKSYLQFFVLGLSVPSSGILGFILLNGFYTTLWGIVILIALLLVGMHFSNRSSLWQLSISLIYANLLYSSWALLAPIPLLVFTWHFLTKRNSSFIGKDLILFFTSLVYTIFSILPRFYTSNQTKVLDVLRLEGGITSINPTVAILLWISVLYLARNSVMFVFLWSVAVTTTLLYVFIGIARAQNGQSFEGYYNEKIFWVGTAAVLPVAIGFFLTSSIKESHAGLATIVISSAVFMGGMSNYQFAQLKMSLFDWGGPSGMVAKEVFRTDSEIPKIFWYYQDPGNDRIGTFWASLSINPVGDRINFSKVAEWAYGQTGQPSDLCKILDQVPKVQIITRNPKVVSEIVAQSCGNERQISLMKGLSN